MSDQPMNEAVDTDLDPEQLPSDELSVLKSRARLMGVSFSNNIGIEALKLKIQAKLDEANDPMDKPVVPELVDPSSPEATATKPMTLREKVVAEAMKLVRVRITNLNPNKKELPGEIFTVANEYIGTVAKYIPYGEATDDGYHIPHCIYENLKERVFLDLRVTKKRVNGQERPQIQQNYAREFALEVLPQLTPDELRRLAAAQAAAANQ